MADRPNILLFMPDQLRADCVGAFGEPAATTPNIDALASSGTRFDNAWSQASVCTQSRISMFTGWYPHSAGHRTLNNLLAAREPNVFASLRDAGYHVALAGSRGDMMAPGVTAASCDRFGYTVKPELGDLREWHKGVVPGDSPMRAAFYGGGLERDLLDFDEAQTRTAIDWLTDGLPEPWCLLVALVYPHPPFTVGEPWFAMHDRSSMRAPLAPAEGKPRYHEAIRRAYGLDRLGADDWAELAATYYGMVSRVDSQLGRVMTALDDSGQDERSAVFFFTDHGEWLGDFGLVEKWPAALDESLVRNPLVVRLPGAPAGRVADSMAEMVDLSATLHELAGIEPRYTSFGRSLVPVVTGRTDVHRDLAFSEGGFDPGEEPVLEERIDGDYERKVGLMHDDITLCGKAVAVRSADWTYVLRRHDNDELYDRSADPSETTNLVDVERHAAVIAQMRSHILDWLLETSGVVPWERDPRFDDALNATWLG